ncbi:MAG: hypothetical protein AAFY17_15920, partial [Cyanobacteria bacterium J06642_11]
LAALNDQGNDVKPDPTFSDKEVPKVSILQRLALFYRLKKQKTTQGALEPAQSQLYQTLLQELKDYL